MNNYNHLSDTQLIQAFYTGNLHMLEELVHRHKDRIYSSIFYLVKDKYLAEDLFQDVFIKIIDTIRSKRYQEEGKFLPWALRIAHNLCVDHFRKVKRTPNITTTDNKNIFDWIKTSDDTADSRMVRTQSHNSIHKMLEKLPEEQKEVIILRHFGDLSFKEISEMTNCSINTALGRMRYGLINLRKLMTERQLAV
jgi:RNA polymerase sigma factor (sigma-70 family)